MAKFPIETDTACQLKWNHSTIFLPTGTTSSCHRCHHWEIDPETFNFHNHPGKVKDREAMLRGEWPGNGCEYCRDIEDAGGTSDRNIHLDFFGVEPPPEVAAGDLTATEVTPTQVEIYFSNTCNLSCMYCSNKFSSTWEAENAKYGPIASDQELGYWTMNDPNKKTTLPLMQEKMFEWLEENIESLHKLIILGGEPFIQPESFRLLEMLERKNCPNLNLVMFSNLTVEPTKFRDYIDRIENLARNQKLYYLQVCGSLDCWGPQAEYVRTGLKLDWYEQNMNYLVNNTTTTVASINSVLTALTVQTLPDLINKINHWSKTKLVYYSTMIAVDPPWMHATIFGPELVNWGLKEAVDAYDTMGDPEKEQYKDYFYGMIKRIENSQPDYGQQKRLKMYLEELDQRRGTDYKVLFPHIAQHLDNIIA